ncbi:MAG TPA: acyltransferase [Acidimicrobiales bacterium]|nr:acyltransferase [Acidimicrobiales bacterium]
MSQLKPARSLLTVKRIHSLDGLRGVAALMVLLSHVMLSNPTIGSGPSIFATWTSAWWLTDTPIHLFWGGSEAVLIFFVLSGVVLSLPLFESGNSQLGWSGYYPRRIIRLYFPVWGALVFAAILLPVFHHLTLQGGSVWLSHTVRTMRMANIFSFANDAFLLWEPGKVIGVLWTLKAEVGFSLLLPIFFVSAKITRRIPATVAIAALSAAMIVGVIVGSLWILYLPVFGFGVVLAARKEQLKSFCSKLNGFQWTGFGVLAIALLLNRWLLANIPGVHESAGNTSAYEIVLSAPGAAMIVVLAWHCKIVTGCLNTKIVQWLGSRSYSLYLIHFPILLASAVVLGGWAVTTILATISLSFCAAELFHRFIEVPSIALSHRVGRRMVHLMKRRSQTIVT